MTKTKSTDWISEVHLTLKAEKLNMPRAARVHREKARTFILGESKGQIHRDCVRIFTKLNNEVTK